MAQIKGLINAKGGGTILANNGAYFVDLTNATESSGTYTIPSADIENGDFTLQVGDTLIDKATGSMLKIATLTPDITATLVYEASSGGSQLYEHNITIVASNGMHLLLKITNDSSTPFTSIETIISYLAGKGYNDSNKLYPANGYHSYSGYEGTVYAVHSNSTLGRLIVYIFKINGSATSDTLQTANTFTTFNDIVITL